MRTPTSKARPIASSTGCRHHPWETCHHDAGKCRICECRVPPATSKATGRFTADIEEVDVQISAANHHSANQHQTDPFMCGAILYRHVKIEQSRQVESDADSHHSKPPSQENWTPRIHWLAPTEEVSEISPPRQPSITPYIEQRKSHHLAAAGVMPRPAQSPSLPFPMCVLPRNHSPPPFPSSSSYSSPKQSILW